jgi:hypothetical protein
MFPKDIQGSFNEIQLPSFTGHTTTLNQPSADLNIQVSIDVSDVHKVLLQAVVRSCVVAQRREATGGTEINRGFKVY